MGREAGCLCDAGCFTCLSIVRADQYKTGQKGLIRSVCIYADGVHVQRVISG